MSDPVSIGTTILIAVASSSVASVLSALVVWWKKSGVEEASARARDERLQAELLHFRNETERMFHKTEQVMNGYGERLGGTEEQVTGLRFTMHGPTGGNGVYGNVKELLAGLSALSANVTRLMSGEEAVRRELAALTHEVQGIGRRLKHEG